MEKEMEHEKIKGVIKKLSKSKFRSSFKLGKKYKEYIKEKGMEKIREHAIDFISKRLSPETIPNDGKQTPMKGHPVFIAQHATGTCCRNCLYKWHKIPSGRELSKEEQKYIVDLIIYWIEKQMKL